MNKMMIGISIVGLVVLMAASRIMLQNSKPQVALGIDKGRFHELSSKPNCVSTQTSQEEKRIDPMPFKSSLEASKEAVKKALDAYGSIVIQEETNDYIYAIATTGLMKYHDDIEVYFDESKGQVHYQSSSRAGYSDMGLNRKRFEAISSVYKKN